MAFSGETLLQGCVRGCQTRRRDTGSQFVVISPRYSEVPAPFGACSNQQSRRSAVGILCIARAISVALSLTDSGARLAFSRGHIRRSRSIWFSLTGRPRMFRADCPAGIAAAAFGGAGRTLSAITCPPPVRELPNPCIEGGGAATLGPPPPLKIFRPKDAAVRCSLTDNRGAGATTSLCPMLMSPTLRLAAASILGGGATTEASGASKACLCSPAFNSGEGAATLGCKFGAWRCDAWDKSGAGATTCWVSEGARKSARVVAAIGTATGVGDHATMFGNATS